MFFICGAFVENSWDADRV